MDTVFEKVKKITGYESNTKVHDFIVNHLLPYCGDNNIEYDNVYSKLTIYRVMSTLPQHKIWRVDDTGQAVILEGWVWIKGKALRYIGGRGDDITTGQTIENIRWGV